ncbi:MAG: translocation/assembly module TamB domain-containing protein [Saprospiraceae bacterium]
MEEGFEESKAGNRKIKKIFRFIIKAILILALFNLSIFAIVKIPAVQEYIKKAIIETVEKRTGSQIIFDHIAINIWDGISLENFRLKFEESDSLISIQKLGFSLSKNLLYLFNNELNISTLRLEGISLTSWTKYNETESNLSRFFKKLVKSDGQSGKAGFLLKIDEIFLKNIDLSFINDNKGTREKIKLATGLIEFDKLDLECNEFNIDQIYLNAPYYFKEIISESCDIVRDLAIPTTEINQTIEDWFPVSFEIGKIEIENGQFSIFNHMIPLDKKFADIMDYNHFDWKNIDINLEDIRLDEDDTFFGKCQNIQFITDRNFELEGFSIDSISILKDQAKLIGLHFKTNESAFYSEINLSYFDYNAFKNYKEEVLFNVNISPSFIDLRDVAHFYKGLMTRPATQGINDKKINLSGNYYGKLNGISGKNVKISIDNLLSLGGSFSTKNLNDYNNTLLNVKLENFVSSMQKIKKLFPTFNPPQNFYKLGALRFNGRYDGYLEDFVAYGKLNTDLGSADLDMRLDLTSGVEKALYSGELNLSSFDLEKWSGNPNFGLVHFTSKVKQGRGLTLKTFKSDIQAVVKSLTFKEYEYKNFTINGVFDKSNFNGLFEIKDPNIDVKFDGNAEFLDNQAFLNFKSTIKNFDLYALNLSKKPLSFRAELDINASGSNINDILGNIDVKNLVLHSLDTVFQINDLFLTSRNIVSGGKELKIASELGRFQLTGLYDFNQLAPLVIGIIKSNYPSLTRSWKPTSSELPQNQKMDFDISIDDSRHFFKLIGLGDLQFRKLELKGKIDSYQNEISLASNIPLIRRGKDSLINVQLLVSSYKNTGDILLHVDNVAAANYHFGAIDFQANSKNDSILFEISGAEIVKNLLPVNISGHMVPFGSGYSFSLLANELNFLGTDWRFTKENTITITKDFLAIDEFELTDGIRKIGLEDVKNQGISAYIDNFDIDVLNSILKDPRFLLGGLSKIRLEVSSIFEQDKKGNFSISVPRFLINQDDYGVIDINVDWDSKGKSEIDLLIGEFFNANVSVDLLTNKIEGKAKFKEAPIRILEYILAKGIQNTKGFIDATVDISGDLKNFKLDGKGKVHKGQTKIIYTGVTYHFDNQSFTITENNIDLTGVKLTDANNNPATITGGLTHNRFKKFGANTSISGDNIIGLQTTLLDNPDYYGYAIGKIKATFTGNFENMDMVIDGVTNQGTQLFIPVGNASAKAQNNVIRFEKRNLQEDSLLKIPNKILKGIDLEMNLTLTPDAQISIIFDADKGDVMRGVGRGNLQIFVKRTGVFDIFGEYQIESGNYLFTVAQLPVAKPFQVFKGGTIRWTGDPVNTTMDIQAVYRSRTSLKPFILEYLGTTTDQLSSQANQRQDVDVILKLGGTLYNPEVSFNLAFPNLVGDLATLADSKLRILQNNELELNSQVFGLIMFNNFLPSNRISDVLGTGGIQTMGINTLSEFLSSQLSLYITSLINLALVENGLLAGVDFEIGLRNNTGVVADISNTNLWPDEIEFRLKNRFKFLDERVTLNMGGNYIFENQGLTYNQMLPDFSLELILTENRKLKARIYGRQELIVQNTLSPKVGLGLAYRTEFGSLLEFEEKLKDLVKKSLKQ